MRKITLVTVQGKKQMCVAELIVLSESQYDKLTDDCFAGRIDAIAKDLHIDWSIDVTSTANVLNVTRTTTNVVDDAFCHDLEIAAANFMSAIDKLEYDKKEPECPSHENANLTEEERETINFVKTLLHDINLPEEDEDYVIGGQILRYGPKDIPFPLPWGKISSDLLKEMCQLYINAHENG